MLHSKFWQGFFAIVPILLFFVAFIAYFIVIFSFFTEISELEHSREVPVEFISRIGAFIAFILIIVFISLGSLIFFIVHAVQNPNLKENNMLIVWILLFMFMSGIGQFIYWLVECVGMRNSVINKG
ncbi:MAG: hypothetical protein ABJN95_14810 [Maribacter sp.]|uniref:hypothetical protein n=1 Tax=Maribacter sp. TaxID=1897614 RepID=UPI003297431C